MKFSIIIPTYSRIDLLERAIKSVAGQTYPDYEIIVVNDNPSDKINIDSLISKFQKIKAIHHLHPRGGNAARNTGISNSAGELIAFLDDDDLWLPEKLAVHLENHNQHPDAGLVFSDCLFVYNNPYIKDHYTGSHLKSTPLPSNIVEAMGRAELCPPSSSIVTIKRECVEKCGLFDETLVSLQDWDYWFRIAHYFGFSRIPEALAHYQQHLGDRTSQNEERRRKGINQICNKWKNEINIEVFTRNMTLGIYHQNAKKALLAGEKTEAFKRSLKLLSREVICTRSIKNFIRISLGIVFQKKFRLITKIVSKNKYSF